MFDLTQCPSHKLFSLSHHTGHITWLLWNLTIYDGFPTIFKLPIIEVQMLNATNAIENTFQLQWFTILLNKFQEQIKYQR